MYGTIGGPRANPSSRREHEATRGKCSQPFLMVRHHSDRRLLGDRDPGGGITAIFPERKKQEKTTDASIVGTQCVVAALPRVEIILRRRLRAVSTHPRQPVAETRGHSRTPCKGTDHDGDHKSNHALPPYPGEAPFANNIRYKNRQHIRALSPRPYHRISRTLYQVAYLQLIVERRLARKCTDQVNCAPCCLYSRLGVGFLSHDMCQERKSNHGGGHNLVRTVSRNQLRALLAHICDVLFDPCRVARPRGFRNRLRD